MLEDKRRGGSQDEGRGVHQFTLVGRGHLVLEGARNVVSFSPEEVLLETIAGFLSIKGEDLHIQHLNLEEGRLVVDGSFNALHYLAEGVGKKGRSILGRLLR